MNIRKCPKCDSTISQSWYLYSGPTEKYKCTNCSTLLEWKDTRYFFLIFTVTFAITLLHVFMNLVNQPYVGIVFAISLPQIVSLYIPTNWFVKQSVGE